MCTQCVVNPIYYGEIAPGWFLMRARKDEGGTEGMRVGEWGLVECNDPTIVFDVTPVVYDNPDQTWEAYGKFYYNFMFAPSVGHKFYTAMGQVKIPFRVKRQWVKNSVYGFEQQFYFYLADFIKTATLDYDGDPHCDFDPRAPLTST